MKFRLKTILVQYMISSLNKELLFKTKFCTQNQLVFCIIHLVHDKELLRVIFINSMIYKTLIIRLVLDN